MLNAKVVSASAAGGCAVQLGLAQSTVVRNSWRDLKRHPEHSSTEVPSQAGGEGVRFLTTRWTMVINAGGDGPARDVALEQFARTYWYPVYAFIRRRGNEAEAAKDLTQGFFARLLEKNWLAGVERRETRFSTLLLHILSNFLVSEHRRETREKRGGGALPLSLDMAAAEQWFGAEPGTDETPERIFERRFALSVLAGALDTMKEALHEAGRGRQFEVLSPFLSRDPAPGDYDAAAQSLGISTNAVAAAVLRLRREYRQYVRAEVAAGLADTSLVDEELRHLAQALS